MSLFSWPVDSRIVRMRQLIEPTPVEPSPPPRWLLRLVRSAIQDGSLGPRPRWPVTLREAERAFIDRLRGNYDHPGRTRLANGEQAYVLEPYASSCDVGAAQYLAHRVGAGFRVSGVSWWNPPYTIRLEFTEKLSDEEYQRMVAGVRLYDELIRRGFTVTPKGKRVVVEPSAKLTDGQQHQILEHRDRLLAVSKAKEEQRCAIETPAKRYRRCAQCGAATARTTTEPTPTTG